MNENELNENENVELVECTICGEMHPIDECTEVETGVYICNECGADDYVKCEDCGDWVLIDDTYTTYDDRIICSSCFDNYTYCYDCERLFPDDYVHETYNGNYVCEDCLNDNYFQCNNCDEWYPNDYANAYGGEWYCDECYAELQSAEDEDEDESDLFHDYGYKPTLKTFYTEKDIDEFVEFYNTNYGADVINADYVKNDPTMHDVFIEYLLKIGFELETEKDNSDFSQSKFCEIIHNILGDFVYFKYDGSLINGVEIVSHAFTLNWLRDNETKIKEALDKARDCGYISHKYGRCGLHFHINRRYYMRDLIFNNDGDNFEKFLHDTDRRKYTSKIVNKLNLFFETYKKQITAFSRRDDFKYCHFLTDEYISDSDNYNLDTNVLNYYKDEKRYLVVNNQNNATIELRVFRGSLIFETFMATCEFVFNLAKAMNETTSKISWSKVVNDKGSKYIKDYCLTREIKNTTKYLKDYAKINETNYKSSATNILNTFNEIEPTLMKYGDVALDYVKKIQLDFVTDFNTSSKLDEKTSLSEMRDQIYSQLRKIDGITEKINMLNSLTNLIKGVKERFQNNDFDTYYLSVIDDRLRTLRCENLITDNDLNEIRPMFDTIRNSVKTSKYARYLQNA